MTAALLPLLPSQSTTTTTTTSKSTHLQDPLLLPFLAPSFSPTAYLNTSLPRSPLSSTASTSTTTSSTKPPQSLATITHQTTTHQTTLLAQTSRLSTALTSLTDEILRHSSRLSYEIEILQNTSEDLVAALSSSTTEHPLQPSLHIFLPPTPAPMPGIAPTPPPAPQSTANTDPPPTSNGHGKEDDPTTNLRTLQQTHHALHSLKLLFSLAMSWEMPPSLLLPPTTTNPLASIATVTSPVSAEAERRGQFSLSRIRAEIEGMLDGGEVGRGGPGKVGNGGGGNGGRGNGGGGNGGGGKGGSGVEKARARVGELRACVGVWKGTSEEKARGRWVEEVAGWVEEEVRRRGLDSGHGESGGVGVGNGGRGGAGGERMTGTGSGSTGAGFLRRLREEIYMD